MSDISVVGKRAWKGIGRNVGWCCEGVNMKARGAQEINLAAGAALTHSPGLPLQGSVPPEVIQAAGAALSAKQQAAFQAYMAGQVPEAADE